MWLPTQEHGLGEISWFGACLLSLSVTMLNKQGYLGSSRPCSTPQAISLTALLISWRDVYAKQTFRKHLRRKNRIYQKRTGTKDWNRWFQSTPSLEENTQQMLTTDTLKSQIFEFFTFSKFSWNNHVTSFVIRQVLNTLITLPALSPSTTNQLSEERNPLWY